MPVSDFAADALVTNGVVRTMDAAMTVAQAVAIKDGRIVGIGTHDELRPLVGTRTRVVDAGGRTVFPGFIDGHTHFQKSSVSRHLLLNWESFNSPPSIPDALRQIAERVVTLAPGEWLRSDGLQQARLAEKRLPTRWEIDAVAPKNPVAIVGMGNHYVAANSLALALAGIDRNTPDPAGGTIERDERGEPNGILRELAKLRLDPNMPDTVLPQYPVSQRLEPLKKTIAEIHSEGITSLHDVVVDPVEVATWIRLRRSGELTLRTQLLVRGVESKIPVEALTAVGLEHGLGDEWLRFGGMKISIDGVCAYRAAAVYDAYPTGPAGNYGFVRVPQDELDHAVAEAHRHGIRLAIHAVGPRAVDMALDAIERASDGTPRPDLRHRLEHVHLPPRPGQLERIVRNGILVSVQPSFVWKLGDAWIDVWGRDGVAGMMPLRKMLNAGIRLSGGTDFPGTPISPFLGLRSAIARKTHDGATIDASQALTLDEALRLQTTAAAYAGFDEKMTGSLELGKLADLVIVSEDPYALKSEQLDRIKVDLTMVGGNVVFERVGA